MHSLNKIYITLIPQKFMVHLMPSILNTGFTDSQLITEAGNCNSREHLITVTYIHDNMIHRQNGS